MGFLIVTCLLIIYVVYFGITLIRSVFLNITRNRRTINKISRMNDMEQAIIFHMYNKPGYTMELDYNDPITKGLLARNYIYTGNNQIISMDVFTNALPIKATLQPFVYQAIDAMKPKIVFCKPFLHKIAKTFCRLLHLHFVGNCKTSAGSYSASHKPLQSIFNCYNTRYGNGSSEFSSSRACSLK